MYGIILFGMPCSGKSTIGKLLADKYNYEYISSGDIARKMARHNSIVGDDLNAGKLAPEKMMRTAIYNKLWECKRRDHNFILDGFPRFVDQEYWLITTFYSITFISVYIDISEQTAIDRAHNRERGDDISIIERIDYYKKNTYPLAIQSDVVLSNEGTGNDIEELVDMINMEVDKCVDYCKIR